MIELKTITNYIKSPTVKLWQKNVEKGKNEWTTLIPKKRENRTGHSG